MKHYFQPAVALVFAFLLGASIASAQTTAFTYQGRINDGGPAASGQYDFIFRLYNLGGAQIGTDVPSNGVQVTNGIFTVQLDFTAPNAFDGSPRFLEIAVKKPADPSFTTLSPRQPITSTPYSIKSINADNATQLGGVAANQYVLTGDSRMTDARSPLPNSGSYIQNQNAAPQATSNFDISGTGKAATFDAATQYNIGGSRVLSNAGLGNLFAGVDAGQANPTGPGNSFFGFRAGRVNTTGEFNSFFGLQTGYNNTTGSLNTFVGSSAGFSNTTAFNNSFFGAVAGVSTTTGFNNTFVGSETGSANTTGSNNTLIGFDADLGANNLSFATALGSGAVVSTSNTIALGRANGSDAVRVPGNLTVLGTLTANLPAGSGSYIQNTTSPQATSNFNISGTGTAGVLNAATRYDIGGSRVLSIAGTDNVFAGVGAGQANTGIRNSFFGRNAGLTNTTGESNSFFGWQAGQANDTGAENDFFGARAGISNTSGSSNSFFGRDAGLDNTTGNLNSFFGRRAGNENTTGSANSFFGASTAEPANTTGNSNSFFGAHAGLNNTTGNDNSFFGVQAGNSSTTGTNNTIIGKDADVSSGNLFFATAIGSHAVVNADNTIVLGKAAGTYDSVARPADAVVVPGFVYREYTAATRSAAIPIAYGSISGTGAILSGTGNFTVAHTVTGEYDITISGEVYSNSTFTVTTTPIANSPRITAVADVGTAFRVNMWILAGTLVDNAFHFTIWKANPN